MVIQLVAIGASLGGAKALQVLLPRFPNTFSAAVVIGLHRAIGSEPLAQLLQKHCAMPLEEAQDKTPILPGHVYLAPADYHLLVEGRHFALSTEAPVSYARPSIDVLFESAADSYGPNAVGIILTGVGHDGAEGLAAIKRHGGLALVQAPETAERADMPKAALARSNTAIVLGLEQMVPFLMAA
jgi:two-component system chemotaxis response regulator CheB